MVQRHPTPIPAETSPGPFTNFVVSHGRSQYSGAGGVSACGLIAMNCARLVLVNESEGIRENRLLEALMQGSTMDEVLGICSSWPTSVHLDVEDIIQAPIFNRSLLHVFTEFTTSSLSAFTRLLSRTRESSLSHRRSACVIITRPPEIIACFYLICAPSNVFVIFDSHPRPNIHPDGAAFVFNSSLEETATYLTKLLSYDRSLLAEQEVQWQAQLLSQVSGHIFVAHDAARQGADVWKSAAMDASLKWLSLHSELSDIKANSKAQADEVAAMRQTIERLEHARASEAAERQVALACSPRSAAAPRSRRKEPAGIMSSLWQQGSSVLGLTGPHASSSKPRTPSHAQYPLSASQRTSRRPYVTPTPQNPVALAAPSPRAAGKARESAEAGHTADDHAIALQQQRMYDEENWRLVMEQRTPQANMFECGICTASFPEDGIVAVDACGHTFCGGCLRNHVTNQLKARPFSVMCPGCIEERMPGKMTTLSNGLLQQIGINMFNQYSSEDL